MNELQKVFNYGDNQVRTVIKNDEIWFVGKDVATILGFKNSRDAIATHVHEDDKGVDSIDTLGGSQNMVILNESGLYALIFGSRLSEAKEFKHWVTKDVLPSIRKHGAYMTDDVLEMSINNPDYMIGLLINLKEERQKRQALEVKSLILEQQVAEAQPKLTYYDTILNSTKLVTITQIAKDYGLSGQALNKILHEEGVQYKLSGQWLLYHQHANKGYTKSQTHIDQTGEARMNTKWTQKGRLFIHEILISLGYDPDKKIA